MTEARTRPASGTDRALCRHILPRVSRTFALGIGLLPDALEHSVLVSYLLCRVADTIEDTTLLDPPAKVRLLAHFGRCLDDETLDAAPLQQAFAQHRTDDERLTYEADVVLREFYRLPAPHQLVIGPRVQEMCAGMAEFAGAGNHQGGHGLTALATIEDLDRYCYYVAGTVGHLLTDLFRLQNPSMSASRYRQLRSRATSFGLGLQITNIVKDVAHDRARGWSFVPRQLCHAVGIQPEDMQHQGHRVETRRVLSLLVDKAKLHLCDALDYCTALPRRAYRVRLFCLTPLYLAVQTLRRAERDPALLDTGQPLKVSRREVRRTVAVTKICAPVNTLVRRYFRSLAGPEWSRACRARAATPEPLLSGPAR